MMKQKYLNPLIILAVFFSLSCSDGGPEETFELMRQRACEGDVEGFFAYVDNEAVAGNYNKRIIIRGLEVLEGSTYEKIILYIVSKLMTYDIYPFGDEFDKYSQHTQESLEILYWGPFERDIPKGKDSELCAMQIESINNNEIKFVGAEGTWEFKKTRQGWKLVSFNFDEILNSDSESTSVQRGELDGMEDARDTSDDEEEDKDYDFRKTRWGMTETELKKAYAGQIAEVPVTNNEPDNTYSNLEIKEITVFGESFKAIFWMDSNTNKLVSVVTSPVAKGGNYVQEKLFSTLVDELTEKYGKPDKINTRKGYGNADWFLASTHIELAYLSTDEYNEHLFLIYKQIK